LWRVIALPRRGWSRWILCFGGRRVRGKKGRGAGGKTIVFGILEHHGKVYTEIVPNAAKKPLSGRNPGPGGPWQHHLLGRLEGLVDRGYKKHFHV